MKKINEIIKKAIHVPAANVYKQNCNYSNNYYGDQVCVTKEK